MGSAVSQDQLVNDIEQYDLYEIIGVRPKASQEEITKAYRKKAKKFHPDRLRAKGCPSSEVLEAEVRMRVLNEAYKILGDPEKKVKYDGSLTAQFQDLRMSSQRNVEQQNHQGNHRIHTYQQNPQHSQQNMYQNQHQYPSQFPQHLDQQNYQHQQHQSHQPFDDFQIVTNDDFNTKFNQHRNEMDYQDPLQHGYGDVERTTSTSYSPNQYAPKQVFGKKSFDHTEFNAVFEHYRNQSDAYQKQLIKIEEPEGYDLGNSLSYASEIASYNGIIIDKDKSREGYNNVGRYHDYSQAFHGHAENPDTSTRHMPKQQIVQQYMTNNQGMNEPVKRSDLSKYQSERANMPTKKETEMEYMQRQQKRLQQEQEEARNIVNRYARHQFPEYMLQNANMGTLETSQQRPESYLK